QLQMPVFADPSWANHPWGLNPVPQRVGGDFLVRGARNALGNQKSLVVLVEFADVAHRPEHTAEFYQRRWFGEGPSVGSYFAENSYGLMALSGTVYPRWIQLPEKKGFYDYWERLLTGIRNALDPEIDFREYDRNGDRLVDHLVVVVAGAAATTQVERNFRVSTREGVYLGPFVYLQEADGLGVSIHEFAHNLGLEDQFKNATGTEFVGYYGLMGFGLEQSPPAHINVYNKLQLGWIMPEEVVTIAESGAYSLEAIEDKAAVYKVPIPAYDPDPKEYFLIVNRHKEEGFDSALPDQGLVIWHVDEFIVPIPGGISPNMRTEYGHRHLTMTPASGEFDILSWQAPFYAGNTANEELTPTTIPSSDGYYLPSGISITDISGKGPIMSFRVILPEKDSPTPTPTPSLTLSGRSGPPLVTLMIAGKEQISGLGTDCWTDCVDTFGIPTAREALPADSPLTARLRPPVEQPVAESLLSVYPVTVDDHLGLDAQGLRWWSPKGEAKVQFTLTLEGETIVELSLEPGLYLLWLHAGWQGRGDAHYGFLVEVQS
ncbi:MAG: hypothetical protein ACE5KI_07165, partial [Dehalococcoidia bacterium]